MSDVARLEIRRLPDRTEIRGPCDETGELEVLAEVEGSFDVLKIAKTLLEAELAVTDSLSEEIRIRGARGTTGELLKLAAIQDDDARRVAAMLVTATLPQLDALNRDAGPLSRADFSWQAAAAANAWWEIDQPALKTLPGAEASTLTLEWLEQTFTDELARQEEALEREFAARERALAPVRGRIDAFIHQWLTRFGTRHAILQQMEMSALRGFIERHVLEHATFPLGQHTLRYAGGAREMCVDFQTSADA